VRLDRWADQQRSKGPLHDVLQALSAAIQAAQAAHLHHMQTDLHHGAEGRSILLECVPTKALPRQLEELEITAWRTAMGGMLGL
jgi:hypothetical protein